MCITDEKLREKLDGELTEPETLALETHLAACSNCQRRAEAIAAQSERMKTLLSVLEPLPNEALPSAASALASLKSQRAATDETSLLSRIFAGRFRWAWGALASVGLVLVCLSFAPLRSWADRILGLLRVEKVTVIGVDFSRASRFNPKNEAAKLISQLLSKDIVFSKEAGSPEVVDSGEEASELAQFEVRLPTALSDQPTIKVADNWAFDLTIDRSRLHSILDEVGHPELRIPASADGGRVSVHMPKAVSASYGPCFAIEERHRRNAPLAEAEWSKCALLIQFPSPNVITPPGLNLASIAEVVLQLAGMPAAEARAFSETVDWTSTLVIPVPRDVVSHQEVIVDGVKGTLIQIKSTGRQPAGYSLLWVRNGIVYALTGFGDIDQGFTLAGSLD